MNYYIDIQHATEQESPVTEEAITQWAQLALRDNKDCAELTIRLVDNNEMIQLNHSYRNKNKTTNVLAFPAMLPEHIELEHPFLGDIIICPEVLLIEAREQHKTLEAHWALIVMHGVLHLLGYDHIEDHDAEVMQALEIKLLAELGYTNPYDIEDNELE